MNNFATAPLNSGVNKIKIQPGRTKGPEERGEETNKKRAGGKKKEKWWWGEGEKEEKDSQGEPTGGGKRLVAYGRYQLFTIYVQLKQLTSHWEWNSIECYKSIWKENIATKCTINYQPWYTMLCLERDVLNSCELSFRITFPVN